MGGASTQHNHQCLVHNLLCRDVVEPPREPCKDSRQPESMMTDGDAGAQSRYMTHPMDGCPQAAGRTFPGHTLPRGQPFALHCHLSLGFLTSHLGDHLCEGREGVICSSIHPVSQSVNKHLRAYYVSRTVLGAGDTIVKK